MRENAILEQILEIKILQFFLYISSSFPPLDIFPKKMDIFRQKLATIFP